MKKLSVMALALVALLSCKKEMVEPQTKTDVPQPQLSVGSLLDYEYYTPAGDVETEIRAALLALENDESLSFTSINRGVWLLETGISYLIQDQDYAFIDFSADTNTYTLSLNDLGEVSEANLKSTLIALHGAITSATNDSTKHIATDVKVTNVTDDDITFIAISNYLTGVNQANNYDCDNVPGPPFTRINFDHLAGQKAYCGNTSSGNESVTFVAQDAKYALRCLTAAGNRFYTVVATYSSVESPPNIYFSSSRLLGGSNAPFVQHQALVTETMCIFSNELNTYTQVIYDDITSSSLMGKDRNFISLSMTYSKQAIGGIWHCGYEYRTISLGELVGVQLNSPLSLSFL